MLLLSTRLPATSQSSVLVMRERWAPGALTSAKSGFQAGITTTLQNSPATRPGPRHGAPPRLPLPPAPRSHSPLHAPPAPRSHSPLHAPHFPHPASRSPAVHDPTSLLPLPGPGGQNGVATNPASPSVPGHSRGPGLPP